MSTRQQQSAEGSATALQAARDVVVHAGMSYAEVKEVALDIFEANFYRLAGVARDTAEHRAQEITEIFLTKLQKEHPEGFGQANDPGFQHALFTVQKEHARTGDKDLADLLVDLLVDRSKQKQRDLLQIVLDESLGTAPKLTEGQLAILAIVFLFKYTQNQGVGNHDALAQYFDKFLSPFAEKAPKGVASYQHLEFTGCGTIGMGQIGLEELLGTTYQGQFLKGFEVSEIQNRQISIGLDRRVFIPCLNDGSKWQVRANSHEVLDKLLGDLSLSTDDKSRIKGIFDLEKMTSEEIKAKCIAIRPYMARVFDTWSESPMKNFTLTSVGIAIAHANIKRLAGDFANLAVWIN